MPNSATAAANSRFFDVFSSAFSNTVSEAVHLYPSQAFYILPSQWQFHRFLQAEILILELVNFRNLKIRIRRNNLIKCGYRVSRTYFSRVHRIVVKILISKKPVSYPSACKPLPCGIEFNLNFYILCNRV